ncbi:DMT family transporter [Aquimarina hainanensis]|uniref:DMT family transporter n=1 Tax=Aquimarina hainanensis TaxID=1578017 RepID=A0ABW5NE52_9FLAO
MSNNRNFKNLLELNLAILFIATSGPLGRYIDMPVPVIIGFRALLAAVLLFAFCKWRNISFMIANKDRGVVLLSGVLMGVHWVTYFYALQLSNVAIGMLSLFTFPVITTILEPLLLKTSFQKVQLLLAVLVLIGIYFLVPDFDVQNTNTQAVGFGVFSAICYSLRNILMKNKVSNYNGSVLMWYQVVIIGVLSLPLIWIMDSSGITRQWPAVLALALLTTAVGHTLFLRSFRKFTVTTASIMSCIQPIYGIILGIFFLHEIPSFYTIIGGLLILSSVVIESIRSVKEK